MPRAGVSKIQTHHTGGNLWSRGKIETCVCVANIMTLWTASILEHPTNMLTMAFQINYKINKGVPINSGVPDWNAQIKTYRKAF